MNVHASIDSEAHNATVIKLGLFRFLWQQQMSDQEELSLEPSPTTHTLMELVSSYATWILLSLIIENEK